MPKTQVLWWVSGAQVRATFEPMGLADYRGRDDGPDGTGKASRAGVFYPPPVTSRQGTLLPLTPQDSVVLYRARSARRRAPPRAPAPQLLLFEVVATG